MKKMDENMKVFLATVITGLIALLILVASAPCCFGAEVYKVYGNMPMYEELDFIEVYEPDDLTEEVLVNRDGKIIIEKFIGICLNEEGDGQILNTENEEFNYIKYGDGINPGDVVLSYCIYNDTDSEDGIISRFDHVIDTNQLG